MKESYLNYHYDNLMKKTEWLFVTSSNSDPEPIVTAQECGRFIFDGDSYTERGSLSSFEIAFIMSDAHFALEYNGCIHHFGKKNDVFFIDCTKGYRLETTGFCDLYFVHFWGNDIKYYYNQFEKYNNKVPFFNAEGLPIGEEMEKIVSTYRNPSDEIADVYAQTLIIKLIQTLIQGVIKNKSVNKYSKNMTSAINYIKDNYTEPLTIELVADKINISRSYLSKIFKLETGLSFSYWLRKYRINKAKELLKNTDMNLDEICYEVGIYDSSYLCKLFKETEHVSPGEYRRNWTLIS